MIRAFIDDGSGICRDKNGNVKQAMSCRLESKKDEKTGRMMMVPIEGSEFTLDMDWC